jgi:hypothetical protein
MLAKSAAAFLAMCVRDYLIIFPQLKTIVSPDLQEFISCCESLLRSTSSDWRDHYPKP